MRVLKYAQVVGQPSGGVWSQVMMWPAAAAGVDNQIEIDGEELVGVSLTVRDGSDQVQELGRELILDLEEWSNTSEKQVDSLVKIIDSVDGDVEILVIIIRSEGLELVGKGLVRGLILREGEVGQVFRGEEKKWKSVRGGWKQGDRLLMGTGGLVREMSSMLIEDVLSMDLIEAGDELVTRVQAADESAAAAGLVLEFEGKDEAEVVSKQVEVEDEVIDDGNEMEAVEKVDEPKVYLKKSNKRRKKAIWIGGLILLLLVVSVGLGWKKRQQMEWESIYETAALEVETKLGQAVVVMDDNPAKAKQLAIEAQEAVTEASVELGENKEYEEKLIVLKQKADEGYKQVSGELAMDQAPVWFDLNLVKEGMFGEKMAARDGRVVVLDARQNLLAAIGLETKKAELVGGGELMGGSKLVDVLGKRAAVLTDSGVVEVDVEKKTNAELVKKDSDWQRLVGLGLYGGNVYLVDASAGEVWRYPGISSGVGERQRWLGAGIEPDLSGVVDVSIDGDIWMVDNQGQVDKYRRGVPQNYATKGMDMGIQDAAAIDVPADSESVYVLDRGNKRVVVLNKETGDYEKQLVWEGLAAATDLVAVEEVGQVLVLSGSSIYGLGLN